MLIVLICCCVLENFMQRLPILKEFCQADENHVMNYFYANVMKFYKNASLHNIFGPTLL